MKLTLHIWRQKSPQDKGHMARYHLDGLNPNMSALEMLDVLNEQLTEQGEAPVEFESDCREGICGTCGFMVSGVAHGPMKGTTVCQLMLRNFRDGEELWLEPWRAKAFPVIKDLIVDRGAFDRIIAAGGYITAPTGSPQDANALPIAKEAADRSMDAAACIGCGACVAACPNASAMLFTSAKITHLGLLPQGQPERSRRALSMVAQHNAEGFGGCTNIGECEAVCPKEIKIESIAHLNHDYLVASVRNRANVKVVVAGSKWKRDPLHVEG